MSETKPIETKNNSPADLMRFMADKGFDTQDLKDLLSVQKEYEANEARKAYYKAMAQFKANPPKIDKEKKVGYSTSKGKVGYSFASLGNVVEKITAELSKYGLSASWRTQQNGKVLVTCRISHEAGHYEETSLSADADTSGAKNSIQAIGSTISYLCRYTILCITGLATYDQDDDGQSVNEEKIDENKIKIIKDSITELKMDEAKFLEYMAVEKIEDILKSDYAKAKTLIETKRRAGK